VIGLNATPTINTVVNTLGIFNGTWNTTGYSAGYYTIKAEVFGKPSEFAVVTAVLTSGPTTTTTTTTTLGNGTTSSTTSTTLGSIPEHPTIAQVISAINLWAGDQMTITDLMIWIQRWASSA